MTSETSFFRSLLLQRPDLGAVRADLAQCLLAAGDHEGAIAQASLALNSDGSLVLAWLVRASAAKVLCEYERAAADFARAAELAPRRASILVNLAHCYAELDRLAEAEICLRRAIALEPASIEAHASLGSVMLRLGQPGPAEAACRAVLAIDPDHSGAHRNLSGILAGTDPAAARAHRDAGYARQQIFVERAAKPERRILVLSAADAANVPLRHLMRRDRTTLIYWYIEYAVADQDHHLPPFDLVFNAIGDPDLVPEYQHAVARLLRERAGQLLNDPARIARTNRSELPGLLANIAGVVVPRVIRWDSGNLAEALRDAGMAAPVLVRPAGSHGGEGVRKIDDPALLCAEGDNYVTEFIDYVSPDGCYRKYRFIFVNGRAYAYHLAISSRWLVHYWTSDMAQDAAKCREEQFFLQNPAAAIGERALQALAEIATRLGLDYAGIDFGLLPDGNLLVFEANATMLVHPEPEDHFAYRNPAVRAIQSAFEAMLQSRQI